MAIKSGLRIKVRTGGGIFGIIIMELSGEERTILETFALGGPNGALENLSLDRTFTEFRQDFLDARFYSKYDAPITSDLERYVQKVSRNLEFVDRLYDALERNKINDLEFMFVNELMVVLGERDIEFNHKDEKLEDVEESEDLTPAEGPIVFDSGPEEEGENPVNAPDPAHYVPLTFSLSPLEGTPLHKLHPGDRVFVHLADATHPLGEAFLQMQTALLDEGASPPDEYPATLAELTENPAGGFFAFLTLSDGSEGLVVEEEPGLRVKRQAEPDANLEEMLIDKAAMQGIHAEPANSEAPAPRAARSGAGGGARTEIPTMYIIAFAAGAVVLSVLLLAII